MRLRYLLLLPLLVGLAACKQPLERVLLSQQIFDAQTLARLRSTEWVNQDAVFAAKTLDADAAALPGWMTDDPYKPSTALSAAECQSSTNCRYARSRFYSRTPLFPAQRSVYQWWSTRQTAASTAEVCGVEFTDESHSHYRLTTFPNLAALESTPGAILTHYHACGTCSSLQDLAVYAELDLTKMGKVCSKRTALADKKACMQEIGLTEACAETWAYNGQKTGQTCAAICIATYGLVPLLRGTESVPPTKANGELNNCLQCDEMMAGPGFQYAAGRTRRASGIVSEIPRPGEQVYTVPHTYF